MSQQVAWTLWVADVDPGAARTPAYWWSGEGDLVFEQVGGRPVTWRGASGPDGALMAVGPVTQVADMAGQRTVVSIVAPTQATRRLWSVDLGGVELGIGWIRRLSARGPKAWTRIPRTFRGRLSDVTHKDGVVQLTVETYLGDIDRGDPRWWSDATQKGRTNNTDTAFEQVSELAGDYELRWPPGS